MKKKAQQTKTRKSEIKCKATRTIYFIFRKYTLTVFDSDN